MTYLTHCFLNAHLYRHMNHQKIDVNEIKLFVGEYLYDFPMPLKIVIKYTPNC